LWKVGFVVNIAWVLHTPQITTRKVVLSVEDIPKHVVLKSGNNMPGIVINNRVPKAPCPMVSFVIK
jgi:hypothetical protein